MPKDIIMSITRNQVQSLQMTEDTHIPLIVIVGPTAVGKTALALALGETFDAEIISADSRQCYRMMDIGTAKPSPEEQMRVRHHLIDIADPDETVGLAQFLRSANAAIAGIAARGKVPFLVGGTGQYVRALIQGWQVPEVPPDPELRAVWSNRRGGCQRPVVAPDRAGPGRRRFHRSAQRAARHPRVGGLPQDGTTVLRTATAHPAALSRACRSG